MRRGLAQELDAIVADADLFHPRDVLGGGLGDAVVNHFAAADVGDQRVGGAGAVAQVDPVAVARPAAVAVVLAAAQRVAEDAVFQLKLSFRTRVTQDRL